MFIDEVAEFPHFKYRPWQYVHETDYGPLLIAFESGILSGACTVPM